MAIWGALDTVEAQIANAAKFRAAFDYLRQALDSQSAVHARISALASGESERVELGDGAFAIEQSYATKEPRDGRLEAHVSYIDLQAIVSGEELVEVIDMRGLTVAENRLSTDDVCFFADADEVSVWRLRAGEVAVFFPNDAHKPGLQVVGTARVTKTVVKVPV